MHACDNPPCCNPLHLLAGNAQLNRMDSVRKRRANTSRVPRIWGEKHHKAKLTEAQVIEIRRRRAGGETIVSLGLEFGVAHTNISMIANRQIWKHI
jgi:hypothetical protein